MTHPEQHGHWDVEQIAALLHERDALRELVERAEADARAFFDAHAPLVGERDALRERIKEAELERDEWQFLFNEGKAGDADIELAMQERDALRAKLAESEKALRTIQQWDCLNPPRADLLGDLPWLRGIVDAALASQEEKP